MHKSNRNTHEKPVLDLKTVSARVDRVNVTGLLRTHGDYVLKVADNLFTATNFEDVMVEAVKAKSYLHELGIFKDVKVRIDISRGDNATPNGYDVTFKGREMSRIEGTIGTEVGQNEGSLHTELTIPNLLGRGESMSLQGSYSNTRTSDISLKFWKCYFHTRFAENRPETSFTLFRRVDRVDVSKFQTASLGGVADFSFHTKFPLHLTHSFQYETAIRQISLLVKNAPFVVREQCGPKQSSLLRYSLTFDQRDHPVFTTRGFMIKTTNEYSGLGGNIAYIANNTHAEVSVPLLAGWVAQVCGRVGVLQKTKHTAQLPVSNLFLCGGPLTLRGFKYGGAGPVEEGAAIGAQTYWSVGGHLWAPLPFSQVFKNFGQNFRTHLFYNFGNFNSFSMENMRSAAGIGLALRIGERARVELNYCLPVHKHASDNLANGFQFGIGYEFV